jgi:hypothetical protein
MEHCAEHQNLVNVVEGFASLRKDIQEIKTALMGDMQSPGWLSRIREVEEKIVELQKLKATITKAWIGIFSFLGAQMFIFLFAILTHKVTLHW